MGVVVENSSQEVAMRTKLAGTLDLGVGLAVWSCGSDDATPTRSDASAGSGGSLTGSGGVPTGGVGIGGAETGGYASAAGGLAGAGATGGAAGGTGGVTGGTGGVAGGTGGDSTGGTDTGGTGVGGDLSTGGTGGDSSGGGAGETTPTAQEAAAGMGKGYNLGQMFESTQHPRTLAKASAKIDAYYERGFRNVRIPITWTENEAGPWQRGSLTVWISAGKIKGWGPQAPTAKARRTGALLEPSHRDSLDCGYGLPPCAAPDGGVPSVPVQAGAARLSTRSIDLIQANIVAAGYGR
jgi:hypothetical protein